VTPTYLSYDSVLPCSLWMRGRGSFRDSGMFAGSCCRGPDASLMADLSLMLLLGREVPPSFCSHKEISPADLARGIAPYFPAPLPFKADVGWRLFCYILQQCEQIKEVERMQLRNIPYHQSCILNADDCKYEKKKILMQHSYRHQHRFGENRTLAILWASVQAELLIGAFVKVRAGCLKRLT